MNFFNFKAIFLLASLLTIDRIASEIVDEPIIPKTPDVKTSNDAYKHHKKAMDGKPIRVDRCAKDYCKGTMNSSDSNVYVCGDTRLGPVKLPMHMIPLSELTTSYDRFGGLCPGEFLSKWTVNGSYRYPTEDGFLLSTTGQPIAGEVTLEVGTEIDRFGSEYGFFVTPALSPYSQRSLPPSNLDTPIDGTNGTTKYPYDYHLYSLKKKIVVRAGPIAPWFGQPGLGTQYKLSKSVVHYVQKGYLTRLLTNHTRNEEL